MPQIFIENYKQQISSQAGLSLLNNFLANQVAIHTVCGGKAQCGCCRVKILSGEKGTPPASQAEVAKLGEKLIAEGWRLSCQTFTIRDVTVYIPAADELDDLCSP